jgi:hypothetical protein
MAFVNSEWVNIKQITVHPCYTAAIWIENMVKFYVSTSKEPVTLKSQWNWQKKDANKDLLSSVKSLLENKLQYILVILLPFGTSYISTTREGGN